MDFIKKRAERWCPLILGLFIGCIGFRLLETNYLIDIRKELFLATLSFGSITIGFLATAKSILFSIGGSTIIKWLKRAKLFNILIDYLLDGINWSFALVIISILGLMINFISTQLFTSVYLQIWLITFCINLLSVYRVVTLLGRILKRLD